MTAGLLLLATAVGGCAVGWFVGWFAGYQQGMDDTEGWFETSE